MSQAKKFFWCIKLCKTHFSPYNVKINNKCKIEWEVGKLLTGIFEKMITNKKKLKLNKQNIDQHQVQVINMKKYWFKSINKTKHLLIILQPLTTQCF